MTHPLSPEELAARLRKPIYVLVNPPDGSMKELHVDRALADMRDAADALDRATAIMRETLLTVGSTQSLVFGDPRIKLVSDIKAFLDGRGGE